MTRTPSHWLNKARFLCRRGNRETELLLSDYAPVAEQASEERKALFMALLSESDARLFNWLLPDQLNQSDPVPEHYRALVRDIRNNYLISNH